MKHLSSISTALSYGITAVYLQFFTVKQALAAFGDDMPDITNTPGGGAGQTADSLVKVINFVLTFLALIAVIFVIVGGFRIMMAGGNEENVTKGRKTIIYAIIGIVVIFFARVIVGFFTGELAGEFT